VDCKENPLHAITSLSFAIVIKPERVGEV